MVGALRTSRHTKIVAWPFQNVKRNQFLTEQIKRIKTTIGNQQTQIDGNTNTTTQLQKKVEQNKKDIADLRVNMDQQQRQIDDLQSQREVKDNPATVQGQ